MDKTTIPTLMWDLEEPVLDDAVVERAALAVRDAVPCRIPQWDALLDGQRDTLLAYARAAIESFLSQDGVTVEWCSIDDGPGEGPYVHGAGETAFQGALSRAEDLRADGFRAWVEPRVCVPLPGCAR